MIATKAWLEELCTAQRWAIRSELADYLLDNFGEEPWPETWSEQDLFEQIRKLVLLDRQSKINIRSATPAERMTQSHERLKAAYIELARENALLKSQLAGLQSVESDRSQPDRLPFD